PASRPDPVVAQIGEDRALLDEAELHGLPRPPPLGDVTAKVPCHLRGGKRNGRSRGPMRSRSCACRARSRSCWWTTPSCAPPFSPSPPRAIWWTDGWLAPT